MSYLLFTSSDDWARNHLAAKVFVDVLVAYSPIPVDHHAVTGHQIVKISTSIVDRPDYYSNVENLVRSRLKLTTPGCSSRCRRVSVSPVWLRLKFLPR